jgi:hypothetical protein
MGPEKWAVLDSNRTRLVEIELVAGAVWVQLLKRAVNLGQNHGSFLF